MLVSSIHVVICKYFTPEKQIEYLQYLLLARHQEPCNILWDLGQKYHSMFAFQIDPVSMIDSDIDPQMH